jgi:hypothetical protein
MAAAVAALAVFAVENSVIAQGFPGAEFADQGKL